MATTDQYTIMGALTPFRQGCRFLGGGVDDQIQINASGVAMKDSFLYGTISAWVLCPNDTGTYTIISYGDDDVIEYITLDIVAGKLRAICCDNTAVQWSFITTNKVLKPHVWHHVAVVQDGVCPKLYVDGEEVTAITRTTSTLITAWFKACAGIDAGSIGAFEGNGDASLTQEFAGYISDVRVWGHATVATDAALTAAQIKEVYRGSSVGSPLNWWLLDGNANDAGTGADNGTIVGDIVYTAGCEFASRLTFGAGTPLVADTTVIACNNNIGVAYIIQAA